jgi:threonine/homoserine/homoserine lactone efflux protein
MGNCVLGIHDLWLFVLAGLLLNATPGPDIAYIVARSAQIGFRGGVAAALGIGTGALIHTIAAAIGLSAILLTSALAFGVLKWIGAAYLIYLGVTMMLSSPKQAPTSDAYGGSASLRMVFLQGMLTNILNPKVALFFLAFLPQFINDAAPSKSLAFVALGSMFNLTGTLWNIAVAWSAARLAFRSEGLGGVWLQRLLGGAFIAIGVRLSLAQQP